ncbi:unnamed protein product [Brassica oleracea var. botrytis]
METWAFAMDKIVTLNTVAKVMRRFAFGAVSEEKNTTGCQLYLSKDSLETAITTAKSSEINVMVPGASPDRWRLGLVEHALPQQYNHLFTEGKFETTPVSHSGA